MLIEPDPVTVQTLELQETGPVTATCLVIAGGFTLNLTYTFLVATPATNEPGCDEPQVAPPPKPKVSEENKSLAKHAVVVSAAEFTQ